MEGQRRINPLTRVAFATAQKGLTHALVEAVKALLVGSFKLSYASAKNCTEISTAQET